MRDQFYVEQYKSLVNLYREYVNDFDKNDRLYNFRAIRHFDWIEKQYRKMPVEDTDDIFSKVFFDYLADVAFEISCDIHKNGFRAEYGKHIWMEMWKYFDFIGISRRY